MGWYRVLLVLCLSLVFLTACEKQGGESVAYEPAMAPVVEDGGLTTKLDGYIEPCINRFSDNVSTSRQRYLSWADLETGPTGQERNINGIHEIYDTARCASAVWQANATEPRRRELELAAEQYVSTLVALRQTVAEASRYYERENYLDDGMAEGQALHPRLLAAFEAFGLAEWTLRDQIQPLYDDLATERVAALEAQGRVVQHMMVRGLQLALRILAAGAVGWTEFERLDAAELAALIDEYEALVDTLLEYSEQNPGAQAANSGLSWYLSASEDYLTAAKRLMRRRRDGIDWRTEGGHGIGGRSGWMSEGAPGSLIEEFNELADHYNDGVEFGFVPLAVPETSDYWAGAAEVAPPR